MSSVVISGDTSGAITVSAPAVSGTNTLTLQAATATSAVNTLGTAVASTSGTSIDFTSLPSWIKRITVMFSGVSTSGTSNIQIQIGAGSVDAATYVSTASVNGTTLATSTTGFITSGSTAAATTVNGWYAICYIGSNIWTGGGSLARADGNMNNAGGAKTLSGTLDRVRITTVNGTDTFDAGTINILYEG